MIKQKTILLSFSKQTIEIPTQNQDNQFITYDKLYNKIKSEFNIKFNFDIFTSETNTLLNADNFTSVILNLTDDIIELYLIVKSQLSQKFNKASNIFPALFACKRLPAEESGNSRWFPSCS